LASAGDASVEDLDRWAVASIRRLDYHTAAMAWYRALRVNPATGIRYQYAAQLATQGKAIQPLPDQGPDGRAWGDWSRAELETLLREKSTIASETLAAAAEPETLERAESRKMQATIDKAHKLFVAAAIEYTLRGYPIRETAFQTGYAPMIFNVNRWSIQSRRNRPK